MYKFVICVLLVFQLGQAAQTDTLDIYSSCMQKNLKAVVVIPELASAQNRLPAVYLLHGYSGKFSDWARHMDLGELADRYALFIICPEGGYNSWYLDSPLQKDSQYASHLINELIPRVDSLYYTKPSKLARAITGLSMGGHGALLLAIQHPDLFTAAASMSGVVDLKFSRNRYEIAEKLGSYEDYPERWKENSVIFQLDKLRQYQNNLLLDCGVNDLFIEINRQLHQKLMKQKIAHTYIERPGGHSWDYWTHALEYHLLYFKRRLR